jgi:hypothetical protein
MVNIKIISGKERGMDVSGVDFRKVSQTTMEAANERNLKSNFFVDWFSQLGIMIKRNTIIQARRFA